MPPIPIPPDNGLGILNYSDTLIKILSPLVMAIVSLALWAWHKQEKTQDKLETALTEHIKDDDAIHDKLFTDGRRTERRLERLIGAQPHARMTEDDDET